MNWKIVRMMRYSSCLIDQESVLVLDTSVIINLYASKGAFDVLDALTNPVVVTDVVINELRGEHNASEEQRAMLEGFLTDGRIRIVNLKEQGLETFARMISSPCSLDDGEAATIAYSLENGAVPVLDERKGTSKYLNECSANAVPSSIDLFLHPSVMAQLGRDRLANLIYSSLINARMRVSLDARDDVIDLIGLERAIECRSLPGYKSWISKIDKTSMRY